MVEKIKTYLTETLWRQDLRTLPVWKQLFMVRPLRFSILTVRAYVFGGTLLHASVLTYITMLAIVPVLTLGLTSLKAFGAGDLAERKIMENIEFFAGKLSAPAEEANAEATAQPTAQTAEAQPAAAPAEAPAGDNAKAEGAAKAADALRGICQAIFRQINSINFATMGAIGAATLIFMVISVLGRIENSFNAIWGVKKPRSILRKFTDYLSVIIVVPMLVLAATSLPILESVSSSMMSMGAFGSFLERLGVINTIVSLIGSTLLFAFLFGFLPNTKVKLPSCFLGAFITALVLMIFFKLCMALQMGIANNSRLYGSLVALPVLLFWIYSSWQIILLGAEICYVHQHRGELLRESAFTHPSERDTIVLALALVLWAAKCVEEDNVALSTEEFGNTFALPSRDVARVANLLERSHLLLPVADATTYQPMGYVLARCATRLTVADVINACLDNTPGEAVLDRAEKAGHLGPLAQIETAFSDVLSGQFSMTIAEALQRGKEAKAAKAKA